MQAIVVDDDEVGAEVLQLVKKADVGRVTVLPLTKMMIGKPRGPAILASKNLEGFAIDLLDFDEKYRNAFWYVLGDTVVARNMDQARANMGGVRIVTMTGELIEASGAMTGGSTKQFQMKFGAASPGKLEEAAAKYHQANDALDALRNGYRDFFAVAKEFPADPEAAPVALKRRLGAAGIRLHAAGRDLLRAVRRHGVRSDALRDALTFFEED